jgi:hypothetical protein
MKWMAEFKPPGSSTAIVVDAYEKCSEIAKD